MTLQKGEVVGGYEIVGQVGQGGMATVYKAYHARLERFVAIKIMHPAFLADEDFRRRFEREARIVAKLEHHNIVPIYDYNEHNDQPFLVMRYIEGGTLKRKALKSGITLEETARVMSEIASALDYAHKQGVLHRDMKPSNILMESETKPYITDFGLARIAQLGASTMSADMMLGTPFYISPEQAQGSKDLDHRTDIYSFGVILYELITGILPFTADAAYAIVYAHIHQAPTPPSHHNSALPKGVDAVLLKALAKQPTDRYASATALMADFAKALQTDEPSSVAAAIPIKSTVQPAVKPAEGAATPTRQPEVITDPKGTKLAIEGRLDLGDLGNQLSRVDWNKLGNEMRSRVEGFASMIEERIDSELNSRGSMRVVEVNEAAQEEQVRRRVKKRLKERDELRGHIFWYIVVNIFLWGIWFMTGRSFPWPLMVMGGWGIGVVAHIYDYRSKYGRAAERKEELFEREVARELERSRGGKLKNEKPKNDAISLDDLDQLEMPPVRLNDEGELSDSFVEEQRGQQRGRKRS